MTIPRLGGAISIRQGALGPTAVAVQGDSWRPWPARDGPTGAADDQGRLAGLGNC